MLYLYVTKQTNFYDENSDAPTTTTEIHVVFHNSR